MEVENVKEKKYQPCYVMYRYSLRKKGYCHKCIVSPQIVFYNTVKGLLYITNQGL